jgi:ABC-type Fe3+/spermidine/putrescine transport system ATPase subunit
MNCGKIQIEFENIVIFSGNSGSGKTTLLKILLGIESGGQNFFWKLDNKIMSDLSIPERRIGMVFQDYVLFPHLTCRENIAYPAGADLFQVDQLIREFGLEGCQHRKASVLSGGEKQRTALARALAYRPHIIFLDEPFSALDTNSKFVARARIYEDLKKFKVPTILVTHDPLDYQKQDVTILNFNEGKIFV